MRLIVLIALVTVAASACGGNPNAPTALPRAQDPTILTPPPMLQPETWIVSGQSNAVDCTLPLGEPYAGCTTGLASFLRTDQRQIGGWAKGAVPLSVWDAGQPGWIGLETALRGGSNVTTVVWWQGETEATTGQTAHYAGRLSLLVARIRGVVGRDVRLIVMGLLDAPTAGYTAGYAQMRSEQQVFVAGDVNARWIDTQGIPLNPENPYHLTADGYQAVAGRVTN